MNAQTRSGKLSLLCGTAYSGHMSVVNLPIKYAAEPRLCDSDGQIPLHKVIMKLLWFEMNLGQSGFEIISFLWCFPLFQKNYCQ